MTLDSELLWWKDDWGLGRLGSTRWKRPGTRDSYTWPGEGKTGALGGEMTEHMAKRGSY